MRRLFFSILILLSITIPLRAQAGLDAPEQKQAEDFIKQVLSQLACVLVGKDKAKFVFPRPA